MVSFTEYSSALTSGLLRFAEQEHHLQHLQPPFQTAPPPPLQFFGHPPQFFHHPPQFFHHPPPLFHHPPHPYPPAPSWTSTPTAYTPAATPPPPLFHPAHPQEYHSHGFIGTHNEPECICPMCAPYAPQPQHAAAYPVDAHVHGVGCGCPECYSDEYPEMEGYYHDEWEDTWYPEEQWAHTQQEAGYDYMHGGRHHCGCAFGNTQNGGGGMRGEGHAGDYNAEHGGAGGVGGREGRKGRKRHGKKWRRGPKKGGNRVGFEEGEKGEGGL